MPDWFGNQSKAKFEKVNAERAQEQRAASQQIEDLQATVYRLQNSGAKRTDVEAAEKNLRAAQAVHADPTR